MLDPELLLLGLLYVEQDVAAPVLGELELNYVRAQQAMGRNPTEGLDPSHEPLPTRPVRLSPETKQALERAVAEAKRHQHRYKGTEHLLLGLLGDENDRVARLLSRMGASAEQVRQHVEQVLDEQVAG